MARTSCLCCSDSTGAALSQGSILSNFRLQCHAFSLGGCPVAPCLKNGCSCVPCTRAWQCPRGSASGLHICTATNPGWAACLFSGRGNETRDEEGTRERQHSRCAQRQAEERGGGIREWRAACTQGGNATRHLSLTVSKWWGCICWSRVPYMWCFIWAEQHHENRSHEVIQALGQKKKCVGSKHRPKAFAQPSSITAFIYLCHKEPGSAASTS